MSIKEKILQELDELSTADLLKVKTIIGELKRGHEAKNTLSDNPYLRVRNALKNLKSDLSPEVISERDERS